ncbi:oxidase [Pelagivirga sediminicola]|uniref:Oxidase n=1 Tax=Pelagivirga sediminicola TaxID=2170575 RepID=A0A2T7G7R7_9RHOB|nr:oxidase [Pelagivirga sediminicola]
MLFYVGALTILTLSGFTVTEVLRDLTQQTGQSSFLGFLSSIGTWLWVAGAAMCFFGAALRRRAEHAAHRRLLHLLGGFSFVLALDDFFLIHDRFIAEGILLPLYALFILIVAKRYWSVISKIEPIVFFIVGGLLAGSIFVDAVQEILPISYAASQIVEEGFKFVGAAAWMYFCARLSAHDLDVVQKS